MMALIRVVAVALALASTTAWSSHPYESARDQYGVREDSSRPSQLLNEATIHHSKKVETSTPTQDLQVGCGEGHIHEKIHESDKNIIRKWKGFGLGKVSARRKRSFTTWTQEKQFDNIPQYQSIAVWKPPIYQLKRPYFIPIYGNVGTSAIYYPPQPWPFNPGYPKDNPKRPFVAPTYLPPTTTTDTIEGITVGNRNQGTEMPMFNGRPIWSDNSDETVKTNPTSAPSISVKPTRLPQPSVTSPPLVHGLPDSSEKSENPSNNGLPNFEKESPMTDEDRPLLTTRKPSPALPNQPNKCVWAIISCCSSSGAISYDCFEQRGCSGPFWDNLPCESDFAKAALSVALNYYEAK